MDPYVALLNQIKGAGGDGRRSACCLGSVTAAGRGALNVAAEGLLLEKEDLSVSVLLDYSYNPNTPNFVYMQSMLRAGDQVLLLPAEDRQRYYLIAKVADA